MGGTKQHRPFLLLLYFCGENKQIHLFRVFCTITVYPISTILKSSLEVQNTKTELPDLLNSTGNFEKFSEFSCRDVN